MGLMGQMDAAGVGLPCPRIEPVRHQREGRHYSCRGSCGGSVVLVDEAAEAVATADLAFGRSLRPLVGVGRPEFDGAMRSLAVVGR